ncbi:NADH-quinone oxidoreductase subunit K [Planctopirus ephydatiae]|uniref:NADH-quinone oxidoreductase subunit K n=1 Tax=Planctopirus ephydatiae TaxID=2528019 RepID=A0A518GKR7_9PLAN|nr:NADH-quinone oxidoreductase subunit NuoK [Planctopirus ephydatiae]QDV29157.1 NADH-quinone oxidoreductase subunit K [Planctopirus ephydatiae]
MSLGAYLAVSAVLFASGLTCMMTKRHALGVLMGVELILNSACLNLIAFARYTNLGIDGQVFALFVIVIAAAEAAVALAIALNYYNNFLTVDVDRGDELKR